MDDLLVAVGLVLGIEGLMWAVAPGAMRRLIAEVAAMADRDLATVGWLLVAVGCVVVWLVRG